MKIAPTSQFDQWLSSAKGTFPQPLRAFFFRRRKKGMKISAIVPWFGSKRTLAPTIVEELGRHRAYFEPFCGSLAVIFAKPETAHETVNDLHGDLINLAWVLQDEKTARVLYEAASRTLCHETLCEEAAAALKRPFDPRGWAADTARAYHFLVASWMSRNGVGGTRRNQLRFGKRYTPGGGHGGQRWANVVESMPDWHWRLRPVTILRGDGFDLLERIEDVAGVAIYADPPYLPSSLSRGRSAYEHNFTAEDHRRLAVLLGRFHHARVVVSYYDAPELAELYPAWTVRKCYRQKNLHVQNRRAEGKCEAPEVLLLNGPSFSAAQDTLFPE